MKQFRTAFFGGNDAPATVRVEAEQTSAIEPIRVDSRPLLLNPYESRWTEDFRGLYPWVATLRPGRDMYLLLWGAGLDKVPTTAFSTGSPGISIVYSETERGIDDYNVPFVQLTLQAVEGARPGARTLCHDGRIREGGDEWDPGSGATLSGPPGVLSRIPPLHSMRIRNPFLPALSLALLLLGAPASAYVIEGERVGGKPLYPRWTAMPVRFQLNEVPAGLIPNLVEAGAPEAAIDAAMLAWAVGPIRFERAGTTDKASLGRDGVSLITFANTPANRDSIGNFWAWTGFWYVRERDQLRMQETDIAFNPRRRFATNGDRGARDLQDITTHELGHSLGLHHSPIAAATMFADGLAGQTLAQTLTADDLAGALTLYEDEGDPGSGGITGKVLTTAGDPVFAAHVVATDAAGITQVGAVTAQDGTFSLTHLSPGLFQVYAEPLDGPMTVSQLPLSYRSGRSSFRTTFAGGNTTPTVVRVEAGEQTALEPIRVPPTAATLNPQFLAWATDGTSFPDSFNLPLEIEAGRSAFMGVVGARLDAVPDDGFSVSGNDVTFDDEGILRGSTSRGHPFVVIPLTVAPDALPGPRNLHVTNSSERAVFTAAVSILEP